MPKSKTIDFYLNTENIIELIKENSKVCDFAYEYIKKEMFIKKYENKGERKEILSKFTEEEITLIINTNSNNKKVRELLDKYIENKELSEISDFQERFTKKFGYSYPLIEYNKLLSKNISFYNFSLFENLNSIIVDYTPHGKINSDLFLVSYSQREMKKQNDLSKKIIEEERLKYEKMATAITRTQTAFRLSDELLKRLKLEARKQNRSLNNFVESVLMDAVYRTPNNETLAAMEEARESRNLETINLDNLEGFIESL
jgi:predicted HicB family RNase H-like nuclease